MTNNPIRLAKGENTEKECETFLWIPVFQTYQDAQSAR